MDKLYTYTCIFLKLTDYKIWESTMEKLEEDMVIFKVVKMSNLYLFKSPYKTPELYQSINKMTNESQAFFLNQEIPERISDSEFSTLNLDEEYSKEYKAEMIQKKEKNSSKVKKDPIPKKSDINWEMDDESILNSLLEKIGQTGVDSLTDQEKDWLGQYN